MSATMNWVIEQMQCIPQDGPYTDVVITANWRCTGVQASGNPSVDYTSTLFGTASFPMPSGSFTPYADLTQDQVLGWCWANGVNKDYTEAQIQSNIDLLVNPPIVTPPLPWYTPPASAA